MNGWVFLKVLFLDKNSMLAKLSVKVSYWWILESVLTDIHFTATKTVDSRFDDDSDSPRDHMTGALCLCAVWVAHSVSPWLKWKQMLLTLLMEIRTKRIVRLKRDSCFFPLPTAACLSTNNLITQMRSVPLYTHSPHSVTETPDSAGGADGDATNWFLSFINRTIKLCCGDLTPEFKDELGALYDSVHFLAYMRKNVFLTGGQQFLVITSSLIQHLRLQNWLILIISSN